MSRITSAFQLMTLQNAPTLAGSPAVGSTAKRRLLPGALALLAFFSTLFLAPTAEAQKPAKGWREFPAVGMKFKSLKELSDVPVNDRMKSADVIAQGTCDRGPQVKTSTGGRFAYEPSLYVFFDEPDGPLTGEDQESARRKRTRTPADYASAFHGANLEDIEPEVEEFVTAKKVKGQRHSFLGQVSYRDGGKVDILFDVFTFYVGQSKLIFVWDYPSDKKNRKKWSKAVERSMKSVRDMKEGSDDADFGEINSESSYEDLLAYHQHDVDQTPGWDLIETPSKNYLIKTNSEDRKDIKAVIKRLEASRRLFEEDFPPPAPITSVSVVRICGTRDEFNTYGQTGGGVAGFFNPGSEELVLFFGDGSIEETMGVMTHEGFHQYCHFLFNRSEAHRWFDEGHGDYYGAWKMKGKNLTYYKDMKGGLSRLPHLKELFRGGMLVPLKKHIRFDHGSWQNQGPQGISNYCQSFGLISYLRLGARKKVKGRYWKKEYAEILPNYIKHLAAGYEAAYADIRKAAEAEMEALKAASEPDSKAIARVQKKIDRPFDYIFFWEGGSKQDIWDKAMAESWGKIDEAEFEENWLAWIEKSL